MSEIFIHEFPLKTSPKEEKILLIILESARYLYNAVLYVKEDTLDICQAKKAWPSASQLLKQAISRLKQTAIESQKLSSFGLNRRQSSCLLEIDQ